MSTLEVKYKAENILFDVTANWILVLVKSPETLTEVLTQGQLVGVSCNHEPTPEVLPTWKVLSCL